jgi:hypothetical protein
VPRAGEPRTLDYQMSAAIAPMARQLREISNVSGETLLIHAGVRLLQIVLQRSEGSAVYQGRFARQDNL